MAVIGKIMRTQKNDEIDEKDGENQERDEKTTKVRHWQQRLWGASRVSIRREPRRFYRRAAVPAQLLTECRHKKTK